MLLYFIVYHTLGCILWGMIQVYYTMQRYEEKTKWQDFLEKLINIFTARG